MHRLIARLPPTPSRATARAPRCRRCRPSRRTRCEGPAARRDRRRCRRPRLRARAASPIAFCRALLASSSERSANCRQTEVLERIAGSLREMLDPVGSLHPAIERRGIGIGARDQRVEAADPLRPVEREQPVLDAQHRGRVDRLALEDAVDQLAAFGQAEDLRQRARRRLALEPLDGARAEHEHAVRRLAAERLLPAEGADIDLRPVDVLRERGRGRVADR